MSRDSAKTENDIAPVRIGQPTGVVSILEVYTVSELRHRLGWSESALRAAKRRGLRLLPCGKRRYVTGKEVVRFLESLLPTSST